MKKPSGHQYRMKRAQREAEEAQRQAQRDQIASNPRAPGQREPLRYEDVPAPDLSNTASVITYAARMAAVSVDRAALDVTIPEEARRREVREGCKVVGLVRDRAAEQESIKRALQLYREREKESPHMRDFVPIPPRFIDGDPAKPIYYGSPDWRRGRPIPNGQGLTPVPRFVIEGGKAWPIYPGEPGYETASTELPRITRPAP